jgi:Fe-S-cluster containining protein
VISSRSRRDQVWNACADKTCCRTTRVHVTGSDLARIVSSLELPPVAVVSAAPLRPPDDADGFLLRAGGPAWELVLRKNGPITTSGAPCVFLVETNDGHAICGAGDVRPTSCRAFPATAIEDGVTLVDGVCMCRAWSREDLDESHGRDARRAVAEEVADRSVIARWNRRVVDGRGRHTLAEFCEHLLAPQRSAA